MLTDAQQRNAAKKFAAEWNGSGSMVNHNQPQNSMKR